MTEKKENILNASLKLFGEYGYASVSTSKVAKEAGVSEGLIFRHFENKEGLLKSVIMMGLDRIGPVVAPIFLETDPEKILKLTFEVPKQLINNDREFWSLIHTIKFQHAEIYQSLDTDRIFDPIINKISGALDELGWEDPDMEAATLMLIVEGILSRMLKQDIEQIDPLIDYISKKYI